MKLIKIVAIGLAAVFVVLVLVGMAMSSVWSVERAITIRAAPQAIHPHVAQFNHWPEWNPCLRDDPAMVITYEGAPGSIGSIMRWKSEKLGNGSIKLVESDPDSGMHYELLMDEFEQPAHGSITLEAEGSATKVRWQDTGDVGSNPVMKVFVPLLLEPMMGKYFARGLDQLRQNVESRS